MGYHEILFARANEEELNEIIKGRPLPHATPWISHGGITRLKEDEVGVLFEWNGEHTRPLALIADDSRHQRLFGRFAQLRNEFSPLSSWAHCIAPRLFEVLDELRRSPALNGYQAAWAGLIVAEAQLLSGSSPARLRIASCLATASFAIARGTSLWRQESLQSLREKYEQTRRILSAGDGPSGNLLDSLEPIWRCLSQVTLEEPAPIDTFWPISDALAHLRRVEPDSTGEARWQALWPVLDLLPDGLAPTNLVEVSPDGRLKLFDAVIAALDQVDIAKDPRRYYAIGLIAGFVATVAAGGAPSISLAAVAAQTHPTVLAWAYVVGGIGEKITWTSSFEGLGRLVVRELERPFHLDEGPLADFAYPEMKVLADRGLSDPLVHLKIKQARTVVVALSPGVNVVFPLNEQKERNGQQERSVSRALEASAKAIGDPMAVLVEALWPYLERKIDSVRKNTAASKAKGGKGRPLAARQEQDLPFEERAKNKR